MRGAIASFLISATIALLPIYNRISVVDFNRTSKDNLLMILFGLFGTLFKDGKRSFPVTGWAILAIALFLNIVNQYSVISINVMFHSFYIASAMFFFVRLYECYDSKYENFILNGMCAGVLIQSVFVIGRVLNVNLDPIMMEIFNPEMKIMGDLPPITEMGGTLGNTNLFGGYIALCSFAFFRKKWIYLLPIPIACLVLSNSMMAIGSFLGGVFYYLAKDKINHLWFYSLAVFAMFLAFFTGLNGMDSGRFEIWGELFKKYDMQILLGYGPGWFADQKITWRNTIVVQEHNIYLTALSTFGVFGLFGLVKIVLKAAQTTNRIFGAVLFAFFLNGYGHFSTHQSTMVIVILCTFAICLIKEENNDFMERSRSSE